MSKPISRKTPPASSRLSGTPVSSPLFSLIKSRETDSVRTAQEKNPKTGLPESSPARSNADSRRRRGSLKEKEQPKKTSSISKAARAARSLVMKRTAAGSDSMEKNLRERSIKSTSFMCQSQISLYAFISLPESREFCVRDYNAACPIENPGFSGKDSSDTVRSSAFPLCALIFCMSGEADDV